MGKIRFLPWRPPRIESGPLTLTTRRLYILPTRAGLVFGVLLLGLLLGAMNYGLSLAYLFTFWFAGVALAAMLLTHRNLLGLTLRAEATAPVYAGETSRFHLHLEAPDPRRRLRLRQPEITGPLADATPSGQLDLPVPQPRRGWHTPGRFALESTWPLGLFRCWTVLELDWGVLVYPAPATERLPLPHHDPGDGDAGTRWASEGSEFHGLRQYRPGDPPRRIAWKSMARGGQSLLTKEFAGSAAPQHLWLDWRQTPGADAEARLSRLTRWVLDAHAAGLAWGLILPGCRLPPHTGEAHLRDSLEALARV